MIIQYEEITYDLTKMHTKQLINLLRYLDKGSFCECCHELSVIREHFKNVGRVRPFILEELTTREHIPNKQEAKMIRKQKAVQQKNQKNKKYRNR